MSSKSKKYFAANWKLHKTPAEAKAYFEAIKKNTNEQNINHDESEFIFFPTASSWQAASESLNTKYSWGAQNVFSQASGAYTGENSAEVLKAIGGRYVLIGHSERRHLFSEPESLLKEKLSYVLSLDLIPVFCVGEKLEERQAGKTNQVLQGQLHSVLSGQNSNKKIIVAYEPVWAIGTGQVATPAQVADTHAVIKNMLSELGFAHAPLLYGGSVKPENSKALLEIKNVDGFLIGGASLDPKQFLAIAGV
jgi:triosephosphate isomerase (TIM)